MTRIDLRPNAPAWLATDLIRELDGRLWHATDQHRFKEIVDDGQVIASAKAKYPNGFCRGIGAVSLFDLAYPDPLPPAAHWSQWISRASEGPCYWLEIDRKKCGELLLSPPELLELWKRQRKIERMRLIAGIESAHVGPISLNCVRRVLVIEEGDWSELAFWPPRHL